MNYSAERNLGNINALATHMKYDAHVFKITDFGVIAELTLEEWVTILLKESISELPDDSTTQMMAHPTAHPQNL